MKRFASRFAENENLLQLFRCSSLFSLFSVNMVSVSISLYLFLLQLNVTMRQPSGDVTLGNKRDNFAMITFRSIQSFRKLLRS